MKTKCIAALLAVVVMIASGLPAVANPVSWDTGTVFGYAEVGVDGYCNRDGTGKVTGQGLGLPHRGPKNAKYVLQYTELSSVMVGLAHLQLCGWLTDVAGLGAACGMSKGHDGRGQVAFLGGTIYRIKHFGWKASAATAFVATGSIATGTDTDEAKSKAKNQGDEIQNSTIIAQVRAGGGLQQPGDCWVKGSQGYLGRREFSVWATYQVVPVPFDDPNDLPVGTCKSDDNAACLYHEKGPKDGG